MLADVVRETLRTRPLPVTVTQALAVLDTALGDRETSNRHWTQPWETEKHQTDTGHSLGRQRDIKQTLDTALGDREISNRHSPEETDMTGNWN